MRGFESFAVEAFQELSKSDKLEVTLFKGKGKTTHRNVTLPSLGSDSPISRRLAALLRRDPMFIEQLIYFFFLAPRLRHADVVLCSDRYITSMMWFWRRLTKAKYKILFSNGGPTIPPFTRQNHIHQIAPDHLQLAIEAGMPAEKQTLLTYGIKMTSELAPLSTEQRTDLRHQLKLPVDLPIVISVAALNKGHKRMDYLIREVAALLAPRPFLLMVGQHTDEVKDLSELAERLLGRDNFTMRSVSQAEVGSFYRVADVFVLASLAEGFGRVFIEALSHGLPCLAHDHAVMRFALSDQGFYADFSQTGSLTSLLVRVLDEENSLNDDERRARQENRQRSAHERYSWESLQQDYVAMIQKTAHTKT